MKPEILFLAHRIPYPPDKGDKIRSWHVLKHLCERYRVHLCAFVDDARDLAHKAFLETYCESATLTSINPKLSRFMALSAFLHGEPMSVAFYRNRSMARSVDTVRARPLALEYVFSSSMAQYIETPLANRKRIVDFCDADSEKWRQYAANARFPVAPLYAREARLLANAETEITNWADASFAVSPEEANIFNARADVSRPVDWFANGVDTSYFAPVSAGDSRFDCVFVGAMDYRANVDGVMAFIADAWPRIRRTKPDARLAIVGSNPTDAIRALDGKNGVIVTGRVDDVRPYLAGARVSIAPLRVARGVQNKVLEAMAMGKAVVASPEALTGVTATPVSVVAANIGDDMAGVIIRLLGDEPRCAALGAAARALVVNNYGWDAALSRLDTRLTGLGV